jgi:hypothetical protein
MSEDKDTSTGESEDTSTSKNEGATMTENNSSTMTENYDGTMPESKKCVTSFANEAEVDTKVSDDELQHQINLIVALICLPSLSFLYRLPLCTSNNEYLKLP